MALGSCSGMCKLEERAFQKLPAPVLRALSNFSESSLLVLEGRMCLGGRAFESTIPSPRPLQREVSRGSLPATGIIQASMHVCSQAAGSRSILAGCVAD